VDSERHRSFCQRLRAAGEDLDRHPALLVAFLDRSDEAGLVGDLRANGVNRAVIGEVRDVLVQRRPAACSRSLP
jgi:hypothetical protein